MDRLTWRHCTYLWCCHFCVVCFSFLSIGSLCSFLKAMAVSYFYALFLSLWTSWCVYFYFMSFYTFLNWAVSLSFLFFCASSLKLLKDRVPVASSATVSYFYICFRIIFFPFTSFLCTYRNVTVKYLFSNLVKRQDEDYDEQVEESLQDEVSWFGEFFHS